MMKCSLKCWSLKRIFQYKWQLRAGSDYKRFNSQALEELRNVTEAMREDSTHGHHQMVNTEIRLMIFFAAEDGKISIHSAKTRQGADYGSDHGLLIAKFRQKLKKAGKTTRSLKFDLNQIRYDYTAEVTNRFKWIISDKWSA